MPTLLESLEPAPTSQIPTFAIASMSYGANEWYERAMQSHQAYADKHGYAMYVLREEMADGFWNKPAYLQSLISTELLKPEDQRVDWILWVDADSIMLNPSLGVDIFMPPTDFPNIHLIYTRDYNGLNTGIFFMRVHAWTVDYFAAVNNFTTAHPTVPLGYNGDQDAMAWLVDSAHTDAYHANVLYQPRTWYNAYQEPDRFEGEPGSLLVHFPGLFDYKWERMEEWFNRTADHPRDWDHSLATTAYPERILDFWRELRRSKKVLAAARAHLPAWDGVERQLREAQIQEFARVIAIESGDVDRMKRTREAVQHSALGDDKFGICGKEWKGDDE